MPYDIDGALYSSKRSSDVTGVSSLADGLAVDSSLAREKRGFASRSVNTMGCSIAPSMPRFMNVKSRAFSCCQRIPILKGVLFRPRQA